MSILSIDTFDRNSLERLFIRADEFASSPSASTPSLSGLIIAMLFFQASTRTRLSFETAALRLGAQCIGFAEPGSARAGPGWKESIADTARVLNGYANAVVVRHNELGAAAEYAKYSNVPVINAGDGFGPGAEHPTQAILDLYTLRSAFKKIDGLEILLVGDLRQRTPHSLLKALTKFEDVRVHLFQANEYQLSSEELEKLQQAGVFPNMVSDYKAVIGTLDAVYLCGMENPKEPSPTNQILTPELLGMMRQDAIIMHPLPRGNELPASADDHSQAAYFHQAALGVPTRMAILESVLLPRWH